VITSSLRHLSASSLVFWIIVAIGIFPAALAAVIPPGVICVDLFLNSQFFCEVGINRSSAITSGSFQLIYIGLAVVGTVAAINLKKFWRLIAVVPLLVLSVIPVIEGDNNNQFAAVTYITTEEQITAELIENRIAEAISIAEAKSFLSAPDTSAAMRESEHILEEYQRFETIQVDITDLERSISELQEELSGLPTEVITWTEDTIPPTTMSARVPIDSERASALGLRLSELRQQLSEKQQEYEPALARFSNAVNSFNASLDVVSNVSPISNEAIAWQALGIFTLLALIVMMAEVGMRNPIYIMLSIALLITAILTSPSALPEQTSGILFSVFPFLLFVVTSSAIRLVALAFIQNQELSFDRIEFGSLVRKTLSKWWIVALFAAFGFWASSQIDSYASQTIYCIGQADYTDGARSQCDPAQGTVVRDWPERSDIEGDIDLSIDAHFDTAEALIDARLQQILESTDGSGEAIRLAVLDFVFDGGESAVLPAPLYDYYVPSLRPPSCGWFPPQVGCYFERQIKKAINAAYENTRSRERLRLSNRLAELGAQGEAGATDQLLAISAELHTSLNEARFAIKAMVANVFFSINMLNLFANFVLVVALVKSFIYIFARFYFEGREDRYLSMETDQVHQASNPRIVDHSSNYVFSSSENSHYANRKYEATGAPGNISVPLPLQGIIRRVLSRTWVVNHVELSQHPEASIQTGQAAHFVEWKLREGEKIYVDPSKLVSFSKGVRFKTEVSLRITSIMFGRLLFLTVTGPGVVVFRTVGEPIISQDTSNGASFSPRRFVAWAASSSVGITARTDLANIYFSSSQIALRGNDQGAVIDANTEDARGIGAVRFIPACVLPF